VGNSGERRHPRLEFSGRAADDYGVPANHVRLDGGELRKLAAVLTPAVPVSMDLGRELLVGPDIVGALNDAQFNHVALVVGPRGEGPAS
jgi:hypothetical protein